MNRNVAIAGRARERGASLIMALVILVLLMLVSVAGVMVSNTQMKLAGNIQYEMLAQADAESALAQAENWLSQPANTVSLAAFGTAPGLYTTGSSLNPMSMTWDDSTSIKIDAAGNQRYVIELWAQNRPLPGNSGGTCGYSMPGPCPNVNLFRVTARGVNKLGTTKYVQTLFALRTAS